MDILCVEFVIFLIGLHPYEAHTYACMDSKTTSRNLSSTEIVQQYCRSMPFFGNGAEYLQCYTVWVMFPGGFVPQLSSG